MVITLHKTNLELTSSKNITFFRHLPGGDEMFPKPFGELFQATSVVISGALMSIFEPKDAQRYMYKMNVEIMFEKTLWYLI